MGTSWISRKGGTLEKGGGVDLEKGRYDPPYQLCVNFTFHLPLPACMAKTFLSFFIFVNILFVKLMETQVV